MGLYLILHSNYKIVYRNILLGVFFSHVLLLLHSPYSIMFLHLFSCSNLHISPNLHLSLFSQYGHFSFFSFDWSAISFFCSLFGICFGISSDSSLSPSGVVFLDSSVFLSFIFVVSSFFVILVSLFFSFSLKPLK